MCLLTCRIMQNSVFILCGKVFFRLYSMWIIRYYRLITYILHCVSYPSESPITLSLLTDSFIPLFSLIPNQIQEYSEINSIYLYILSFSQNILWLLEYKKVNRLLISFLIFMSIYHFIQNICFFLFYVNQVFHTHKMWIMWITLCITLFYRLFPNSHVWKKCVWFSTPFSFFDRICAKCWKFDFHLCSAQKYNKRSHRLLMHSL